MTPVELAAVGIASVACAIDLKSARIPNALTFSAAAAALVFHAVAPGGHGLVGAAIGLAVGLLVLLPPFALGAMGAGDVKLMAALGAWLGWQPVIFVFLYGSIAGGILGIGIALANNYLRQAFRNIRTLLLHWAVAGIKPLPALTLEAAALRMPYALPIAVGVLVTIWR